MAKASRAKGVRGELEVRDVFRRHGFDVDRVPNSGGLRLKGDLLGVVPVHVEVKRRERLNVPEAFEQATREAPAGREPLVACRVSRSPWLGVVELDYLIGLLAVARDALAVLVELRYTGDAEAGSSAAALARSLMELHGDREPADDA